MPTGRVRRTSLADISPLESQDSVTRGIHANTVHASMLTVNGHGVWAPHTEVDLTSLCLHKLLSV